MNTVRAILATSAIAVPVLVLALSLAASDAPAQFTAAMVPPEPVPRIDTVARADSVKHEQEELVERMTSIKEWVDSAAAALAATPAVAPDSAAVAPTVPASGDSLSARDSTTRSKAPAPPSTDSLSTPAVRRPRSAPPADTTSRH